MEFPTESVEHQVPEENLLDDRREDGEKDEQPSGLPWLEVEAVFRVDCEDFFK